MGVAPAAGALGAAGLGLLPPGRGRVIRFGAGWMAGPGIGARVAGTGLRGEARLGPGRPGIGKVGGGKPGLRDVGIHQVDAREMTAQRHGAGELAAREQTVRMLGAQMQGARMLGARLAVRLVRVRAGRQQPEAALESLDPGQLQVRPLGEHLELVDGQRDADVAAPGVDAGQPPGMDSRYQPSDLEEDGSAPRGRSRTSRTADRRR